jgi:hypothetical protein
MSFGAKWVGLDETVAKYGRIEGELPDELKRLMTKSIVYAQGEIPPYPAPTGSGYRRTGTLGRTVTAFPGVTGGRNLGGGGGGTGGQPLTRVESIAGGVRGVVGGRLEYLPTVVGEGTQAAPFVGRWWTLQKVIVGAKDGIVKIFRAGIQELFK